MEMETRNTMQKSIILEQLKKAAASDSGRGVWRRCEGASKYK